ncbi:hypothetical protein BDE02_02G167600 [Populus trichocarpa]|nr:hypothetical protein BDE02_02G167600 [Populus trichocarpa]
MSRCRTTTRQLRHSCFGFPKETPKPNTLHHARTPLSTSSSSSYQMGNILLVAYLTKTLSESGTRSLDPDSIPLSEYLVLQILRRNSLDSSKKMEFFKWCSVRHIYKHSVSTYSQMFSTLCRSGYLEEVPDLLNSMKNDGVVVGSETFKLLLDAFIRSGKFDSALDILDHMEELGSNPNPHMYDSIIVALAKKNQVGLALSIMFKLLEASDGNEENAVGVSLPGSVACNALLVALRNGEMKVEFKTVFAKLRGKVGFELNTWGYNICIHAFGCWGDLTTSLRLFKEMKEKSLASGSLDPDLCTYNSLIHVLCLAGKVKDAVIVYEELKVSGHEPDAFTYRILIQGCYTVVYNSLLDGMFKARKVMEACQLFEKMVQDGVRASCWTYNILIDGLCKNGRAEAGYNLFCGLKKKGQFVDAVTYSIVVLLLCRKGHLEEALHLVEEMEERGFVVDLITITSLLIAFHKQGRWDCTERLMKHIRDVNLLPNVLKWRADMEASLKNPPRSREDYTPMFPSTGGLQEIMSSISSPKSRSDDGATEDEKSSSADTDQVQAKGAGSFDIDMVNTFLSIFLAKGKLSLACKLFEIFTDMGVDPVSYTYNSIMSSFVKKGCPPDIATYNLVIQGLGKMGRADLASSVLDKLMKQGGYLDIVMYNTLIDALGKAGRIDEANNLFEQMKISGLNPDVVTYNIMIEVHSKTGRLKDAYKFLKMMLDAGCLPNHVTDTTLDFLAKEIEKLRYQKASIMRQKDDSP